MFAWPEQQPQQRRQSPVPSKVIANGATPGASQALHLSSSASSFHPAGNGRGVSNTNPAEGWSWPNG
eukprot:scaffold134127_cov28-Prasinocladus_malaysianus.AAC.1